MGLRVPKRERKRRWKVKIRNWGVVQKERVYLVAMLEIRKKIDRHSNNLGKAATAERDYLWVSRIASAPRARLAIWLFASIIVGWLLRARRWSSIHPSVQDWPVVCLFIVIARHGDASTRHRWPGQYYDYDELCLLLRDWFAQRWCLMHGRRRPRRWWWSTWTSHAQRQSNLLDWDQKETLNLDSLNHRKRGEEEEEEVLRSLSGNNISALFQIMIRQFGWT